MTSLSRLSAAIWPFLLLNPLPSRSQLKRNRNAVTCANEARLGRTSPIARAVVLQASWLGSFFAGGGSKEPPCCSPSPGVFLNSRPSERVVRAGGGVLSLLGEAGHETRSLGPLSPPDALSVQGCNHSSVAKGIGRGEGAFLGGWPANAQGGHALGLACLCRRGCAGHYPAPTRTRPLLWGGMPPAWRKPSPPPPQVRETSLGVKARG